MNFCSTKLSSFLRQNVASRLSFQARNFTKSPRTRGMGDRHTPSNFDKKILVWSKMYKSIEEVPSEVSYATMRKGKDLMRIRVNIGMAVATVIGCIVVISYSKSKQKKGDSLHKRGLQYEADMRTKGEQERAARESGEVNVK